MFSFPERPGADGLGQQLHPCPPTSAGSAGGCGDLLPRDLLRAHKEQGFGGVGFFHIMKLNIHHAKSLTKQSLPVKNNVFGGRRMVSLVWRAMFLLCHTVCFITNTHHLHTIIFTY